MKRRMFSDDEFNIPLNIPQRSVIGLFNELDTEANYAGNALVEYFILKLIHKHYKRIACVSNFRVLFNMIDMSTTGDQYTILDYDFKESKLELLKEAIDSCKNDMFVLYISITFKHPTGPIAHSVVAIINKRLNTLEYYNPHGFTPLDYSKVLENIIVQEKLEKLTMELGLSLSMNAMHCPLQNRILGDPGITEDKGYCTVFASIFVLFRLANYKMSLTRFSIEFLNYTFDMDTNDYARHFSFYILKEVRKFAKNFGIESTHIHDIFLEFMKSHSLNDIVKSINQTGGNPLALLRAAKMAPKVRNKGSDGAGSDSGGGGDSKTSQFLTGFKDGVETMSKISEQSKENKKKNEEEEKEKEGGVKTKLQKKADKVKGWFS